MEDLLKSLKNWFAVSVLRDIISVSLALWERHTSHESSTFPIFASFVFSWLCANGLTGWHVAKRYSCNTNIGRALLSHDVSDSDTEMNNFEKLEDWGNNLHDDDKRRKSSLCIYVL